MGIQNKKVIALLPMKGDSERVPNKNLKNFNGKPLYHRVLNTLLECDLIDQIIINTDGVKIKQDVQLNFNLDKVIINDRPETIQGNFVSMNKIIAYDLNHSNAEIYLQTHSTNPLLTKQSIATGLKTYNQFLNENKADSLFSVTKIQSRFYYKDITPVNHNPKELLRTQDLPPIYEENSCFYFFNKKSFKDSGDKRIGLLPKMFTINSVEAIDIDTVEDFLIAEAIFKIKNNNDE